MCGIAGVSALGADERVGPLTLRMTRELAHRGPDGEGFWLDEPGGGGLRCADQLAEPARAALGHRRLSIVDLAGGAQPMSDPDGVIWVSFNGEIYNQGELRGELERLGHRFTTHCDTEVLVHGWKEWGEALFGRLNGIFAFALADTRQGEIVLVRDPVGVKPLYVGVHDGLTWWSSELGAAAAAGLVSRQISVIGLKLFLTFRFVPSPYTVYEQAWKVPPGHFVRFTASGAGQEPRFHPYDCRIRSSASPRSRDEWSEALFSELDGAVNRQLMADVPVASLLSGGIDSSLVTRMMKAHLADPPASFGIGFASDGARSEAIAAQTAADQLGVPHTSTVVDDREYLDAWPGATTELGEPIANTGALLVRMICERVGRDYKVVLTGQGADEPLGGYPRHLVERMYRYGRYAPALSRMLTKPLFGGENGERLQRALSAHDRVRRYGEIFAVTPPVLVDGLVAGDGPAAADLASEAIARWAAADAPGDTVNELLRIDARLSLADDLLIIADHFSMRSSVELRVPFLDLQLLELLERMPGHYKISRLGRRKWLYSRGALERLPPELAGALRAQGRFARKRGFSTPRMWFETEGPQSFRANSQNELAGLPLRIDALERLTVGAGPRQRALLATLGMWTASHRGEQSARVAA